MTDKETSFEIKFAPGCFDQFEGTQEELNQLVAEIESMFKGKTREEIEAMSRLVTEEDLDDLPEEVQEQLLQSFDEDFNPKRNLQ